MSRGSVAKYKVGNKTRWMFRVDVAGGRVGRKQVTRKGFAKQSDAADALDEFLRTALPSDDAHTDLAGWLDQWIDSREAVEQIRPTTASSYRAKVRYVREHMGGVDLADVTADRITKMYVAMRRKGLSARSVRYLHAVLRKALADAVRMGLLPANPTDAAMPPSTTAAAAAERAVWSAEAGRAFLGWEWLPINRRACWALVLTGGLRRGELAGLRWDAVDGDEVRIERTRSTGTGDAGAGAASRSGCVRTEGSDAGAAVVVVSGKIVIASVADYTIFFLFHRSSTRCRTLYHGNGRRRHG